MKPKILFLFFLFCLAVSACSPAMATQVVTRVETVVVTEMVEGQPVEVVAEATAMYEPEYSDRLAMLNDEPGSAAQLITAPAANRMVIKDAEMELLVRDPDLALANVTQMASDYGGYLISSQTWYDGDFKYATMRLAVPSTDFETALNNLRILGLEVLRETASGQDVSSDYVDLQTRLDNLEATAARVREFLAAAKTVEESLNVSAELSELEGQIEQIKGQMRYYEGRTAFSTVTVSLTPQRPTPEPSPTPTATPGWNPGQTFAEASDTLITVSQSSIDVIIWFAVVIGPFLAIVFLLIWGWRATHRKVAKRATPEE